MQSSLISDMKSPGPIGPLTLIVVKAEMRAFTSKPGQFLSLTLRDRSGELEAKMWEPPPKVLEKMSAGTPVAVKGRLSKWRDRFELTVDELEVLQNDVIDPADFLPSCERPIGEMWSSLAELMELVSDKDLKKLLDDFCQSEIKDLFCKAPASRKWHHGYLGGLLEHTLSVTTICKEVGQSRQDVCMSMLITGAIFHDLGKVDDYRFDTVIDHTTSGKLLGHIMTGYHRLLSMIEKIPSFPKDKAMRLSHIIVSHHGKAEWGAPRPPKTIEAHIVHFADNMDAQVNGFGLVLQEGRERKADWSPFSKILGTEVLCKLPEDS